MQLKYIGSHRPLGMVVDIREEEAAEAMIKSGEYELLSGEIKKKEMIKEEIEEKEETKPDGSWTEMEIYDWIKKNKIPVRYRPASDRKTDVLIKLRKKGYI